MAGQLLSAAGMGALGAVGADMLAHTPMDRAAQDYKDLSGAVADIDEMTRKVFMAVFGQGEMSMKDRMLAAGILSGDLPPGAAEAAKKMADSSAGKKGIDVAGQVMSFQPALGPAVARLANQEIALFGKEAQMGVGPQDVIAAAEQGAGESLLPAALGGLGLGAIGAALPAVAQFQGRRK